ncbi:MAG TPA: hypothetical protein VGD92_06735 [Sphingobacteriaceae bacterium]
MTRTGLPMFLLMSLSLACGRPSGDGGSADTVRSGGQVTGAEESSASDTTRRDGTTEKGDEATRPADAEPAGRQETP